MSETTVADQVRELFEKYDAKNEIWEAAKAAVEDAAVERSNVVIEIAKLVAPKKKVSRNGRELTIVVRPSKDGTKQTTFFKGSKQGDTFEV